ncbi:MAG: hypothetical protein HRU21_12875, partial [Pseudomonadales bacterium]|nr:hypothetical protein [Pseudomonadales bacterium]
DEAVLVHRLIEAALAEGGNDNISVAVIAAPDSFAPRKPWLRRILGLGGFFALLLLGALYSGR